MSLLKTKPRWAPNSVATNLGWSDPVTGEVYVAIGNLKTLLEKEVPSEELIPEPAPRKREQKMEKKQAPKQQNEVKQVALKESQQLLGEVVEIKLEKEQKDIKE